MAHLFPGDGLNIGGDTALLQRIGVIQILDDRLVLAPHIGP